MYQTEMISAHVSISTSDRKWRSQNFTARFDYLEETVSSDVIDKVLNSEWEFRKLRINREKKLILLARDLCKTTIDADYGIRNKCKCKMCHAKQKQPTNISNRAIWILILSDVLHFSPIFWFARIPLSPKPLSQLEFRIRKHHRIRYEHTTVAKIEYNQI